MESVCSQLLPPMPTGNQRYRGTVQGKEFLRTTHLTIYTSSDGNDGLTGERSQVNLSFSSDHRFKHSTMHRYFWPPNKYSSSNTSGTVFSFAAASGKHNGLWIRSRWAYFKGTGEHRVSSCRKRRNHVQTHLLGRDDLADEDKYAGGTWPDCGCGYRRGEHEHRQKPCTRTGIGSHARSGQLHHDIALMLLR